MKQADVEINLNHIYPDERRRELIRSRDFRELRAYALDKMDDKILASMFEELEEWKNDGRTIAPAVELLSSSLEMIIDLEKR